MKIAVYGAASELIDVDFIKKTEQLGAEMVKRGHSLVFGGGGHGLMGAVARGVKSEGGFILGVLPDFFIDQKIEKICDFCDELLTPITMRERKQIMEDRSDAFIIVPGGIGTYEEFFEILTLKQLCRHNKPIAIYNINGYYNELIDAMNKAVEKNFIKPLCMEIFKVFTENERDDMFKYIEAPVTEDMTVRQLKDG